MPELTAAQVIDETVEYYSGHPERFAVNQFGTCQYRTPTGQMCAVGRCLDPTHPRFDEIVKHCGGVESLVSAYVNCCGEDAADRLCLKPLLKPQYRGIVDGMWTYLQELHDNAAKADAKQKFWTESRMLSAEGLKYVEELKKQYA